tara:strand:+ start:477 stop:1958 length:1482 start_codon:yes stop_codon:yes gene_type:complete
MSPISRYRDKPIISVLTGYQRYVSQAANLDLKIQSRRKPLSQHFPLYKINKKGGKTRLGQYVGNHQIINRYRNVESISLKQEEEMNLKFKGRYTAKNKEVLNKIIGNYKKPSTYSRIPVKNVPATEEQTAAAGGKGQDLRHSNTPFGGAQGVDIKEAFGKFQVTTQRLDKLGHHSIMGKKGLGKNLQDEIREINNSPNLNEREKDQAIANEGFNYFKGRLPQWNVILKSIQSPATMFDSPSSIRSELKSVIAGGGLGILHQAVEGGTEMFKKSTGFMTKGASQITSTALGNMQDFGGEGVSYTFVIDEFKHAIIQKFRMKLGSTGGRKDFHGYQWDVSSLKRGLTEVIYGYMATDDYMKVNVGAGYSNDAAAARHFAQTTLRGNNNSIATEVMKIQSLGSSGLRTNSGTMQANIDLVHADANLAKYVKNVLIPNIKEGLYKDSKSFTGGLIGSPEDITGSIFNRDRKAKIWAAPYLSVADYSYEAFGSGSDLK